MRKFLITLLTALFSLAILKANELDDSLKSYYIKNSVKGNSAVVDDYTWIKRIYIDLGGRIPTLNEINSFIDDSSPDRKNKVVDKILNSEDYVNHYYNFWADLLRIRPERLSDDVGLLKSYPYIDYVKTFIREDKSYKDFVFSLLSASGRYTDNGATGYMIRDNGMPLDNLATTLQIFIGKDVACAQCHDDPFQDYTQMGFYQMANLFNSLDNRERRKDYGETLKRIDSEIKEITGKDRIDNAVRQLLSANLFNLKDDDTKTLKLPHDYKYSDGKPLEVVSSKTLDGKLKDVKENRREKAAEWIVENADFSKAISNRIWGNIVGKALIVPETNFIINDYPEGEILDFLGKYLKDNNYSIKKLLRLIVTSDFYNRDSYKGNLEDFKHSNILVKRMSAYQIWDSFLTLVLPDINYSRVSFGKYSDLIEIDYNNVSGKELLEKMEKIRNYERELSSNFLKYKNIDLVRASYILNRNSFAGQFLKEYGSSDRILIDSSNDKGSITQILTIMNSPVLELLLDQKGVIYQNYNKTKDKNILFLSVLCRPSKVEESKIVRETDSDDLIWSLINTREFLFRK